MAIDPAETMTARLRADLKAAMQARRALEMQVLRGLIGAIDNAQAVPVGDRRRPHAATPFGDGSAEVLRLSLSQGQIEAVLAGERGSRQAAAAQMARLGQSERAATLLAEAAIVARYLGG